MLIAAAPRLFGSRRVAEVVPNPRRVLSVHHHVVRNIGIEPCKVFGMLFAQALDLAVGVFPLKQLVFYELVLLVLVAQIALIGLVLILAADA